MEERNTSDAKQENGSQEKREQCHDGTQSILPTGYVPVLDAKETQNALFDAKRRVEEGLCRQLNLVQVQVPLVVEADSSWNDELDRDGSRKPVSFHVAKDGNHGMDAEIVQAATKWKRAALRQYHIEQGEGIMTDMRAIRKDYFLDANHSCYVDQWDWELAIDEEQRTLDFLVSTVTKIWGVVKDTECFLREKYPLLASTNMPPLPQELYFIHAEELLALFPDLPRKQRENAILQEHPATFIIGIGWQLNDGHPHELRASDYDDWSTPTISMHGQSMHGLNGDLLVWNPVLQTRHELSSMGIRVDKEALRLQLGICDQLHWLSKAYHQQVMDGQLPLSIGGGIGQSRLFQMLLQKAHIGEVSVTVWPKHHREECRQLGIPLLE
eukprot:scaffold80_cov325-Pavlova_lutheri.AAC.46